MVGVRHLRADLRQEERQARDDLRPEAPEGQELPIAFVVPVGDSRAPGEEERERERGRDGGGEGRSQPAAAPGEGEARHQEGPERERCPLVLGEHGGSQKEARGDPVRPPRVRPEEQQEGAAIEAGEGQVAVGADRSSDRIEGDEREQGGRKRREGRRAPPHPAPRAAVHEEQEHGEEEGVEGTEDGVGVLPQREQRGRYDLGEGQEERIARVGDVPLLLPEDAGVDRPFGLEVARLGHPGHAAVPIAQRADHRLCEDTQGDQGREDEDDRAKDAPGAGRTRGAAGAPPPGDDPGEDGRREDREDGRAAEREGEEVGERVEAPPGPGDPQEIRVREPLSPRQGADPGEELDEPGPRHGEEGRARDARDARERFSPGHADGPAPAGKPRVPSAWAAGAPGRR